MKSKGGRLGAGLAASVALGLGAAAQTPVILPNTVSSIGGNVPTVTVANSACPTNAQFTATDAVGDGCPAVNAVYNGNDKGITVDPLGNVYTIADSSNPQGVRRIDARTGQITFFAGNANPICNASTPINGVTYTPTDKTGDGCPVQYVGSSNFNGARALGSDPYGNIIFPVTGDNVAHFVCMAVSPNCTAAQVKVNLQRAIAGCMLTAGGYGTAVSGTTPGSAGDGTTAVQIGGSSCSVGLSSPRGATGDKWGNIYLLDSSNSRFRVVAGAASITVNGVPVANPLYTALALANGTATTLNYTTVTQGNIYPLAGGAAAVCSGNTDGGGDGCPFYATKVGSTTNLQGFAVDNSGDFIFEDAQGRLRVIYMGGTDIVRAIAANNTGVTSPVVGYSYLLAGNGGANSFLSNGTVPGPTLGTAATLTSGLSRMALDAAGNVYLSDNPAILFYDINTGYIRRLTNGTTSCNSTTYGDGCPLAGAVFSAPNGLGLAFDALGNLYIDDAGHNLVRRASATSLPTAAVNSSTVDNVVVHVPGAGTGTTSSTATLTAAASSDFSLGAQTCTTNADNSVDCTTPVTLAPTQLGLRNDPLTVATTSTTSGVTNSASLSVPLNAVVNGSALYFDVSASPATSVLGTANTTGPLVVDGDGNTYTSGAGGIVKTSAAGTMTTVSATQASFIAVDTQGNVYSASASSASVTEYGFTAPNTYRAGTTIAIAGLTAGGPLTVDNNGTIYIIDSTAKVLFKYTPLTGSAQQLTSTAFTAPVAMTQDFYGNLLVVDSSTKAVYKVSPNGQAGTAAATLPPTITFPTALVAPTAIAADQAENLYVADNGSIVTKTLAGYQYTIPGLAGVGVAVDGAGNLYTAQTTVAGITKDTRNVVTANFGSDITINLVGALGNAGAGGLVNSSTTATATGNVATTVTGFSQTDSGDFAVTTPASPLSATAPTCSFTATSFAGGSLCNASISFSPSAGGNGPVSDVINFTPAASTLGSLTLNAVKTGTAATTTTVISGNTAGLVYSTGLETTFTVTVTATSGTPSGTVGVSIDNGALVQYALTAGSGGASTATVPVSGLTATTLSGVAHTISATFSTQGGIAGSSTAAPTSFNIAQASTVTTFTPGTVTQQYSAAIGNGVLNATAASGGTAVPGLLVYSATPSGGTARTVHAGSFLPIGTYSLSVTFVPTDTTDFSGSTATVGTYTVTKASTSAPVGASQTVVAADGTGNFTTVQAAVNAVGATGGSIYVKPGTYTGLITVVQPNVAIRGLGGDPTQVVFTNAMGAFSNSGSVYQYAGEFTAAKSNGAQLPAGSTVNSGDEGSATMVVARGVNTALGTTSMIPNNFYGENFTIANTYDSDPTTTTTTYLPAANSGTCTANQGPARTYSDLYNNALECASQALAIWTTSDLAVMNNVYMTSLQDTVYAASPGAGGAGYVPTRQYWFRGKITGDVDYIFGDAAAVFDYTTIYTAFHGTSPTGTTTIHAQNKHNQSGSASDYLSGYVMNSDVFTSQATGMTSLYLGRPYDTFSTWIMLNPYIDQVNPTGYTTGLGPSLANTTFGEFNDMAYTDPATGMPDLNGVIYQGTGGNTGAGVAGPRETSSTNPGTVLAGNNPPTGMTAAQATVYYPAAFLGTTVPSTLSTVQNWNPNAALATAVTGFVPSGTAANVSYGSSVTILMRPQTPGLGAVTNGTYTIPTGTYSLSDRGTVVASGTLDAAGEAYYTTSTLGGGAHSFTWTYGGDANFSGSTTATPLALTVAGATTTTALTPATQTVTYGQSVALTATVTKSAGTATPGGSVTLTIDGTTTQTASVAGGTASFTVAGLTAGSHSFTAAYSGDANFVGSNSSAAAATVQQAVLTITASCANRVYDAATSCSASVAGYKYTDTAATVFTATPSGTTAATRQSPAGTYSATPVYTLSTFGNANYTVTPVNGSFSISGGAPQAILFATLPNFASGRSYQLTARSTSGLPVSYTVIAGNATVSGATLTVSGPGTVTVQASQATDPTGDYAAATPVQRSFTAQ